MRAIFSNKLSIPFDAKDKTRLKTKPNDFNEIKKKPNSMPSLVEAQ